ncbi:hypothetical protein ACG02S_23570 [Roseateles sp. DC23W]|uniref:Secreted protein n=1 Tax=Pelomonas dachongensis TaxID=3299029 RepID=A0ABW7EUU0_9BURK
MRSTVLLSVSLLLAACATPAWVNPKNPQADLQADLAACDADVQRQARLGQMMNAGSRSCMDGQTCAALEQTQAIQASAEAVGAQKRCMAARGWRQ